jgi:hypothetical protein
MSDKPKKPATVLEELQELRDIYLEILRVEARLVNMEQKHPAAARLREVISKALDELEDVRHMLMKDAAQAIDSQGEVPPKADLP